MKSRTLKKISPFLKWAGGKRWFLQKYSDVFPNKFNNYYEPFLGSGAAFFFLSPKRAFLSDINSELINVYTAIKYDWEKVLGHLKRHADQHCKDYYYKIRSLYETEDNMLRASYFLYLNRTCWNGLYRVNIQGNFNVPIGTKNNVLLPDDDFESYSEILKRVEITSCDFEETIDLSCTDDLLFVDPPYTVRHNNNCFIKYNEKLFGWKDQIRLKNSLVRAKNRGVKIIATNAAHESVKELYREDFSTEEVWRQSVIAANSSYRKKCSELLIRGNL